MSGQVTLLGDFMSAVRAIFFALLEILEFQRVSGNWHFFTMLFGNSKFSRPFGLGQRSFISAFTQDSLSNQLIHYIVDFQVLKINSRNEIS